MTDRWYEVYLFDVGNVEPCRLIFLFSPARRMMVMYAGLALVARKTAGREGVPESFLFALRDWIHKWEHECRGVVPRHDDY